MAGPATLKGFKHKLWYGGDGDAPGAWVRMCAIESTEFTQERAIVERPTFDCDVPEDEYPAPTMSRSHGMKTAAISGNGKYATEHQNTLQAAHDSEVSSWWKVSLADGAVWIGRFVMPTLTTSFVADGTSYGDISISLQSDGEIQYTAVV